MKLRKMTPMLHVADIERSLAFYGDRLGFTLVSPESAVREWRWAHLRLDGVDLMLAGGREGGPIRTPESKGKDWPAIYYFYPEDVVALQRELRGRGLPVSDLYVTFYKMKEFWLLDPDGQLLTFGQDTDEAPTPDDDD